MNWTFSGWCCQESEVSGETGEVCSRGHQAERISHVTSMTFFSTAVFIQMYCWFPNTITNIDKAWFWSASEKYLLSLQLLFAYTSCHTICAAPRSSVGTLIVSCLSCLLPTSWAGRHSVVWEGGGFGQEVGRALREKLRKWKLTAVYPPFTSFSMGVGLAVVGVSRDSVDHRMLAPFLLLLLHRPCLSRCWHAKCQQISAPCPASAKHCTLTQFDF